MRKAHAAQRFKARSRTQIPPGEQQGASALLIEAKYDVSRRIEGREAEREVRLLAG